MSIHKLTAGSGYDYLTRQVAALDATDKGHTGLASYYSQRGEQPGSWNGSGLAGLDGLQAGDPVTAEQMQALFGEGRHPLAARIREPRVGEDPAEVEAATRLGALFKVYSPDVSPFRREVAVRVAALNEAAGLPGDWPVPLAERARVRTEVGREFFRRDHGRDPTDARELAAAIAVLSRPQTTAVAGYDLTFSPVKSVSTLWAVADLGEAAQVEQAHQAAVGDALRFLEKHALFTREGANGVRQVDVRGLVAAAFTHRDSRAGDPDLHTHVAVANKVQTRDGRWLAIDGRVLFKATVAASETYNTALEQHLTARLGVRFTARPDPDPRKRPVREIDGIEPQLNARWSARRQAIEARQGELAAAFQRDHGRPPTPVEAVQLAQRATLETRDAKHEPRSLTEQRATWRAQAIQQLGSRERLHLMLSDTLQRRLVPAVDIDDAWVQAVAQSIVARVESERATWQVWHVRAEASRRLRAADLPAHQSEKLLDRIVQQAIRHHSVPLHSPDEQLAEPPELRREDGASVYTVAGSLAYTSLRMLAAEQRLLRTAGLADGRRLDRASVDLALTASAADRVVLDAGQAALVQSMATSGRRLQLAIAPAGAGKTTALAVLTRAWTASGGQVVGLAPSAAAAAQLGSHTSTTTDTLAKLTWALDHHSALPTWAQEIGPATLVLVDEAGMADTLSLDTAVDFVIGRGGSVRLIGDDQQLAAIGAGGVLRDIATAQGVIRLEQLHRFTDPAEAAASLALREGRPEALGFYLDQRRVHVGDLANLTEQVFTAWQTDRDRGLDPVMLAPTRGLVADLNARARTHRLAGQPQPTRVVLLADGNTASVGDVVITRSNDRRLRLSASDWVKNGDRWNVLDVSAGGGLTVQQTSSSRTITLPADYVRLSVELGYATTVHSAQGVTADTMHGLADGHESRQQLYTMLTRGRAANHLYLPVVGDGDPHTVIRPDAIHPRTATDLLEQILACDESPTSATTLRRQHDDPAERLGDACDRYRDALHVAAEHIAGPDTVAALAVHAEGLVPGLTADPAWPTLRADLLLQAADGRDPAQLLTGAVHQRELDSAQDRAAVLDARLGEAAPRGAGPLPWLPAIPSALAEHRHWGGYLQRRAELVTDLANQIHSSTSPNTPSAWAHQQAAQLEHSLVADVEVWRAASRTDAGDLRPTGPRAPDEAGRIWQDQLNQRVASSHPAVQEFLPLIRRTHPALAADPFTSVLAVRVAALSRGGLPVPELLQRAMGTRPLPDDHAAAAVWWRITRDLGSGRTTVHTPQTLDGWTHKLDAQVGHDRRIKLLGSTWWPALTAAVDHGLQRGWALEDLLPARPLPHGLPFEDEALTLLRRAALLTAEPDDESRLPDDPESPDLPEAHHQAGTQPPRAENDQTSATQGPAPGPTEAIKDSDYLYADLAVAAMVRQTLGPLPPSDADHERAYQRAIAWDTCPVTRERLVAVNELACQYYQQQFAGSWGQSYLTGRLRTDLTGHPDYRPGQAPAGWTTLIDHLRHHGVNDEELTIAGLATHARTGQLIDRLRDRIVFPITHNGDVLGFVGRRHPDRTDADRAGPKYLNTPDTPLFHKGAQLYGADHLPGATPVIVEGPFDAIAITLVGAGQYVGVAPLGTALTDEHAAQLGRRQTDPVTATDADDAGHQAAKRAYWLLTPQSLDPLRVALLPGSDPADCLQQNGRRALNAALQTAEPLGTTLLNEHLKGLPDHLVAAHAGRLIATRPAHVWQQAVTATAAQFGVSEDEVARHLLSVARAWNADPASAARHLSTVLRVDGGMGRQSRPSNAVTDRVTRSQRTTGKGAATRSRPIPPSKHHER